LALNAPDTTVTIGGVDFTNNAINFVTIGQGRQNVWEQARSSYAQISLFNPTNANWSFDLNSSVVITSKNATGTNRTLFTGTINNFSGAIAATGAIATVGLVQITALGSLAKMSRTLIGGSGYAKEYDDDRMLNILTDAGVSIDVVDTPGVYELQAYTAGVDNAYALATKYADMAFGYIYETTAGEVGYANESHRSIDVQTYGYDTIPTNYINAYSLSSQKTSADVVNDIFLTYKSNQSKTATSASSIATYGKIAANIATELELAVEAQYQADRYITLKALPETNLNSFQIELLNPNITNADVDILLQMYMGKAIKIDDLPNSLIHTDYKGFVEGWQWNITRTAITIEINSTSSIFSITPTRWQDVSAALVWSAVDPTIQWSQYS